MLLYIPKTKLGRLLIELREKALNDGLTLLTEDEILRRDDEDIQALMYGDLDGIDTSADN